MSQTVKIEAHKVENLLQEISCKQEELRRKASESYSTDKEAKTEENESTNFDSEESKRELEEIEEV